MRRPSSVTVTELSVTKSLVSVSRDPSRRSHSFGGLVSGNRTVNVAVVAPCGSGSAAHAPSSLLKAFQYVAVMSTVNQLSTGSPDTSAHTSNILSLGLEPPTGRSVVSVTVNGCVEDMKSGVG